MEFQTPLRCALGLAFGHPKLHAIAYPTSLFSLGLVGISIIGAIGSPFTALLPSLFELTLVSLLVSLISSLPILTVELVCRWLGSRPSILEADGRFLVSIVWPPTLRGKEPNVLYLVTGSGCHRIAGWTSQWRQALKVSLRFFFAGSPSLEHKFDLVEGDERLAVMRQIQEKDPSNLLWLP